MIDLPAIENKVFSKSRKAKYLGGILDQKLNSFHNIEERVISSIRAFYVCKKPFWSFIVINYVDLHCGFKCIVPLYGGTT